MFERKEIIQMKFITLVFGIILLVFLHCSLPAQTPEKKLYTSTLYEQDQVTVYKNVIYSTRANYKGVQYTRKSTKKSPGIVQDTGLSQLPIAMDVIVPPNAKPGSAQPLIIFIHGGAFQNGDKVERLKESMSYACGGFVAATINYRLTPTSGKRFREGYHSAIKSAMEDAFNAIRFLKANAVKYNIDTNRIATIGTSAGGVMSMLAAVQPDGYGSSDFPGISSRIQAAISTGGTLVTKEEPTNPLFSFDASDAPVMLFHANPSDGGPWKTSWNNEVLATRQAIVRGGSECVLVAQEDRTHSVDLSLGTSPFWKSHLLPFLSKKLRLENDFTTYTYKRINDTSSLELDLFMPEKEDSVRKKPVMIFFHGGGWVGGKRTQMDPQCRYYAGKGFVTVTASYRLLQRGSKGDKSICIRDAKSAIRWIKLNAEKFQIDTNKVILGGGSAGGHLATMAALDTNINERGDNVKVSTKAIALILFNPAYGLKEDTAIEPFDKVTKTAPPVIQFFGDQDLVWKPGGDKFHAVLNEHKLRNELWIAEGEKHSFYNKKDWSAACLAKADNFLVSLGLQVNMQQGSVKHPVLKASAQ